MRPNIHLMKATLTGALGGLLFGFDTIVISGAIDALVRQYGLSPVQMGQTVAIGLVGTVVGSLGAGVVGQKLGGREALRMTAVLYVISAIGCGLAWNWPSFSRRQNALYSALCAKSAGTNMLCLRPFTSDKV